MVSMRIFLLSNSVDHLTDASYELLLSTCATELYVPFRTSVPSGYPVTGSMANLLGPPDQVGAAMKVALTLFSWLMAQVSLAMACKDCESAFQCSSLPSIFSVTGLPSASFWTTMLPLSSLPRTC